MKQSMIETMIQYYKANIEMHRLNLEVLLNNTVGVAEHPNMMETIDGELAKIAELDDKLLVLENYFGD
jgi:hypothetical protein|tara:strand:+ start:2743 stop:2946 length:204 start_codon:yes stop_codon:yes gene_type:complete